MLVELLRLLAPIDLAGDAFGKVYEYFLGNFAMKEGQKGGVFYTPESIVKLIVEIIEPYHGRILDPACGSGGMFVQSANFVERHGQTASREISVYGVEGPGDGEPQQDEPRRPRSQATCARPTPTPPTSGSSSRGSSRSAAASTSSWPTRPSTSRASARKT